MPQIIPVALGVAASAAGTSTAAALTATFAFAGFTISYGAALSAGLSLLSAVSSIAISALGNQSPKQQSTASQTTLNETTGVRFFTFGRNRAGGSLVFWETTAPDGQGNLYRLIVCDCQEIDGVEARFINGEALTLLSTGFVQRPTKWANLIQILDRPGTASQAALPQMLGAFDQWTEEHRLRGLHYVMVRQVQTTPANVQNVYPNFAKGETYTQTFRGAKIYDPRDGVTRWTRNAALILLWAMTHPQFGNLSLDDFSIETWKAAADACDAIIVSPDGNPDAAYTISGQITAPAPGQQSSATASVISDMLQCMDGVLYEDPLDDGKIALRIGVDMAATDAPLGLDEVVSFQDTEGPGLIAQYDGVRVQYTEPLLSFQATLTPAYGLKNDGTLGFLTSDDTASSNILTLELPMIDNNGQAQRIAKKAYLRAAAGRTATVQTNLAGILYRPGETIAFDLPHIPANEVYRLVEKQIDLTRADGEITLDVELIHPGYMQWSQSEGQPIKFPPLLNASGETIDPPANLRAAAFSTGNVRVAWQAPAYPNVAAIIEWGNAGSGVFGDSISVPDASVLFVEITTAFASIDIRARFSTGSGQFTANTTITGISASAILSAPPAPSIAGPTRSDESSPAYTVTPGAVTGIWKVKLYASQDFDTPRTSEKVVGNADPAVVLTAVLPVGQYQITATTFNLSGVESARSSIIVYDRLRGEQGGQGGDGAGGAG